MQSTKTIVLAALTLALAVPLAATADNAREADAAVRGTGKAIPATKQEYTEDVQARQKALEREGKGRPTERDLMLVWKLWTPAF
jgi:hypothetical protein